MMVKLVNDALFQANDGKMLVNDGEMSVCSYTYINIIDEHFTSEYFTVTNEYFTIIGMKWPSFAHLTIIEKQRRSH